MKCQYCNKEYSARVYPYHIERCKTNQAQESKETKEELWKALEEKGIEFDKRLGEKKLKELLEEGE